MSDRHTPETDALAEKLIPIAEKITEFNAQSIIKQLLTEILTKTTKLERERDEAREAIPAGEWVAYEDHKKVHDAASRLLVAINKELPIGCFTLVSSEYYRLQNAIASRKKKMPGAN